MECTRNMLVRVQRTVRALVEVYDRRTVSSDAEPSGVQVTTHRWCSNGIGMWQCPGICVEIYP